MNRCSGEWLSTLRIRFSVPFVRKGSLFPEHSNRTPFLIRITPSEVVFLRCHDNPRVSEHQGTEHLGTDDHLCCFQVVAPTVSGTEAVSPSSMRSISPQGFPWGDFSCLDLEFGRFQKVPLGPSQVLVDVLVDSPTALHQSRKSIAGPRHETLDKRTPSPFKALPNKF